METAFITGASSGIGAAFACQLAARRKNLILLDKQKEQLITLATRLQEQYPVTVKILVADLSNPVDIEKIENYIIMIKNLDILINNAGFGTSGNFIEVNLSKQLDMIHVHIIATMRFCRAALPGMIAHRKGSIINVSSIGAFKPIPGSVTYSSTKAYLVTFSEALQTELVGTGVKVQALCPGFTHTGFHNTPEFGNFNRSRIPKIFWMTAEEVAVKSLKALRRGRAIYIPGFKNRLLVILARIITYKLPFILKWVRKNFDTSRQAFSSLSPQNMHSTRIQHSEDFSCWQETTLKEINDDSSTKTERYLSDKG
ncbi:MAG: SDR family oxidoreductase [wastewater metagenome]|nr:SDR family oxidoreductase [Candidatus Loosdrechtia aerotolerans]